MKTKDQSSLKGGTSGSVDKGSRDDEPLIKTAGLGLVSPHSQSKNPYAV